MWLVGPGNYLPKFCGAVVMVFAVGQILEPLGKARSARVPAHRQIVAGQQMALVVPGHLLHRLAGRGPARHKRIRPQGEPNGAR